MGQSVAVTGIVLNSMPISEYDKRITILTKERGKITAFAKGARRQNSPLLAPTNPFCFGEFELFEGKNAYNVSKVCVHNYFRELTQNVDAAYMGFYFLEFADYVCQENNDEKEMLKLLYQSLRALQHPALQPKLVRPIFELKAISINGEAPHVFSCMHCHTTDDVSYFSIRRGGIFCAKCRNGQDARKIHTSTCYAMQFIISTNIEKLFTFQLTPEVLEEFQKLMKQYLQVHWNHSFKSLQIIDELDIEIKK